MQVEHCMEATTPEEAAGEMSSRLHEGDVHAYVRGNDRR
jgi:hypothetical protein